MKIVKNYPKVSILVPIYGTEKYIARCAESLFQQSYNNIEFIFVNDCTKDDSMVILEKIIDKYFAKRSSIKIINHERNKGLAGARITALANASGEYVMHVDSDDFLPSDSVQTLVEIARKNNYDIISGSFQFYSDGRFLTKQEPFEGTRNSYIKCLISRLGIVPNNIWGHLIKRDLYLKNNINPIEKVDYSEDYSVLPKLIYFGHRATTNKIVYFYNIDNQESYIHNFSEKSMSSVIKARTEIYNFFFQKRIFLFSAEIGMANIYKVARDNDLLNYLKEINFKFSPNHILLKLYKIILSDSKISNLTFSLFSSVYKLLYK